MVSIAHRVGRGGHHAPPPLKNYCEAQAKGLAYTIIGCHHIPASSGKHLRNRLLNSQIKSIHSSTKCLGKGNLKKVSIACRVGRGVTMLPHP